MSKNVSIKTKKKVGLAIALAYWVVVAILLVVTHLYVVLPEMASKNSIGGELFLIPFMVFEAYLIYVKIIAREIRSYIWH